MSKNTEFNYETQQIDGQFEQVFISIVEEAQENLIEDRGRLAGMFEGVVEECINSEFLRTPSYLISTMIEAFLKEVDWEELADKYVDSVTTR